MDINKIALAITRLQMQAKIHEVLLLQMRLVLPVTTGRVSLHESQQMLLGTLEEVAATLEVEYLSSPEYSSMSDSERALYADEFREIVDRMKSSVNLLENSLSESQKKRS